MRISESPSESPISAMFQSKMTRTFHPVGQGAFYSERFYCGTDNVCNVVYDCGTQTNHNNLSKIIGNAFPTINGEKQKINYLFVSHFHEDHINGIKMLLQECDIEWIVIPAIMDKNILLCDYIHNTIRSEESYDDGNWFMEQILSNPNAESVELNGQIIKLRKLDSQRDSIELVNIGWEYILYCPLSGDWKEFVEEFNKEFPAPYAQFNGNNFMILKNSFTKKTDGFERLKKLYKNYYKDPKKNDNYYSMAVLSKPVCSDEKTDEMMCLYTGDYPARDNKCLQELKTYYDGYWKDFKTMQVPHHGSRYDNPKELYDISGRHCVYSYGTNNRFHHPCGKMLSELLIKQESLIPVNEDKRYEKNFEYR
jgi:beta-lactamase superfamily II metal-dependent hydrolase